jgi:ABC-2 type transport system ATP-binding protein
MIEVIDVTQHYGVRPILRDVTLQINRGELVALMGPNGMGKTTLMGVMAGILPPSRGHVVIDGKRRRSSDEAEAAIRKMVVYLPADAWLPAMRTGREWLLAVGRLYGHDDLRLMDHADRLLDLFELSAKQDARISAYSSGQRKKLALSAALITEAPVMLLDEPFSGGLDPAGILTLKRVLQRLHEEHKATIVMSTPVPELVEDLADRIAVVREGQVVAFDSLDGLRRQSGCAGKLEEVYAQMFSPHTVSSVERYFKKEGA